MLLPSVFRESLLDDFFGYDHRHGSRTYSAELMRTDIKDTDTGYEMTMNLPGIRKEDIKAELKDGYLTVSAMANSCDDGKDDSGVYIRRERYTGMCSRIFYVGEHVKQEDIKAKFEDGILKLQVPKKKESPADNSAHYIVIEG